MGLPAEMQSVATKGNQKQDRMKEACESVLFIKGRRTPRVTQIIGVTALTSNRSCRVRQPIGALRAQLYLKRSNVHAQKQGLHSTL